MSLPGLNFFSTANKFKRCNSYYLGIQEMLDVIKLGLRGALWCAHSHPFSELRHSCMCCLPVSQLTSIQSAPCYIPRWSFIHPWFLLYVVSIWRKRFQYFGCLQLLKIGVLVSICNSLVQTYSTVHWKIRLPDPLLCCILRLNCYLKSSTHWLINEDKDFYLNDNVGPSQKDLIDVW